MSGTLGDAAAPTLCQVSASDDVGVARVVFTRDGGVAVNTQTSAPYNCALDTKTISDGTHTIRATAYDASGKATGATRTIVVNNATTTTPPPPPAPTPPPPPASTPAPRTTWAPVGATPLSDTQAAALVTHRVENRSANVTANNYRPSDTELAAFHAARDQYGRAPEQFNKHMALVTGRHSMTNPSTDDIIQWTAQKWGIPEDWIRAEMVKESNWRQSQLGDRRLQPSSTWYTMHPAQARISGTLDVYESLGMSQVKWRPDNSRGNGSESLRWKSSAYAMDFYAATVRYFYDGLAADWITNTAGQPAYSAGQQWASIGAWFSPNPWNNSGAQSYVQAVQSNLQNRVWAQPGF